MWLFIFSAAIFYYLYNHFIGKRQGLPPGPTPWPIFGNVLQLDIVYPERTLAKWSQQYGKLMTLWLPDATVTMNSYDLLKKHFIKNGDVFVNRPSSFVIGKFTENLQGVTFSSGNRWKEQRRFTINTMRNFGFGRNIMEQKIMLEGHWLVDRLTATQQRVFDPWEPIEVAVANIIANILIGHRYEPTEERYQRIKKGVDDAVRGFEHSLLRLVDMWPPLRFLPRFREAFEELIKGRVAVNDVMAEFIEEHRESFVASKEPDDFVETYLLEMDNRKKSGGEMGYFEIEQLTVLAADVMLAGMDTTVTTLRWALVYLINYPEVQEKAQAELDAVIGAEADITMADRGRLPYNSAVVQEIQRISNIVPINLMHAVTEDIQIEGYHIKAGTKCLPQVGNVLIDPEVFPNPDLFDPMRYLNSDGTAKKVEELVPFSIGKRQCLGESLARAELFLLYCTLMQRFRFVAAPEGKPLIQPIPSAIRKPTPFKCVAMKRH